MATGNRQNNANTQPQRAIRPYTSAEVVDHARSLLGTPFAHRGRSADSIDCVGMLTNIADKFKVPYVDLPDYDRYTTNDLLLDMLDQNLIPLGGPMTPLAPGQALVFRVGRRGRQHHTGVVARHPGGKYLSVVHSAIQGANGGGKVVEHIIDEKWRERVKRVYAFPGCIYEETF